MKRLIHVLLAALALCWTPALAVAQQTQSQVVSVCGTNNQTPPTGTFSWNTMTADGRACGTFNMGPGGQAVGITPTDRTITSATGSSQTVMAANASRKALTIENTGNANCGVNPTGGTAAIGGAGTITLAPLGSYSPLIPTLSAVTAICTAAQSLYASEQ